MEDGGFGLPVRRVLAEEPERASEQGGPSSWRLCGSFRLQLYSTCFHDVKVVVWTRIRQAIGDTGATG